MAAGRRSSAGSPLPKSAPDAIVELVGNDGDDVFLRAARGHVNGAWYDQTIEYSKRLLQVSLLLAVHNIGDSRGADKKPGHSGAPLSAGVRAPY
jgi:hypothetical protein